MILTTKIGRFEFDDTVLLSHAKLIRDSILGQWLNPKPGNQILRTIQDCENFIRNHSSREVAVTPFNLSFPDEEHIEETHEVLEDLPQPPLIPVPPIWVRQALTGEQRPAWLEQ